MDDEVTVYASQLSSLLRRLAGTVEGLSEAELNWRPPAPDANSAFVIATHMVANMEAWVLGIVCGEPISRDREAEFAAAGADAAPLVAAAEALSERFEAALGRLAPDRLDELLTPDPTLWGTGAPSEISARRALVGAIVHNAGHIGHLEVTRDLAVAHAAG
ncbi:MAG: DinB family protein [Dehalococcoidia bacterium]